jgi:ppGpp synthetase/RelA/SpoT-type nucleotidyltranferase
MKLFTKSIDQQLFKQFNLGNSMSQNVVVKIFNPYGQGYWYIMNSDPQDPDYLWGIVDLGRGVEVGSVSRREVESVRVRPFMLPLERDISFSPTPAKEIFEGLKVGKRFEEGGKVEDENKEMLENQAHTISHHAKELNAVLGKSKDVEPWVITKAQRASTDLADITHYLEGEKEKMAKGGSLKALETNRTRGDEQDDYGTFEMMKKGGQVEVKIVNKDEVFDKDKYGWLLSDYDNDGVANSDDANPLNKGVSDHVDNPDLSNAMGYLIDLKSRLDENMYAFLDDMKRVAPDNSILYARTKTPYSILNKLVTKRLLSPKSRLTDLIGTTIVTSDKKELNAVKNAINSGKMGKVLEFEDMYANPKLGYRAYHFLVERDGLPIEVQVKTKRQKSINELGHAPYKANRLDAEKYLEWTKIADDADEGDKEAIKKFNKFMSQKDIANTFYKEDKTTMAKGGRLPNGKYSYEVGDEGMYKGGEVAIEGVFKNIYQVRYLDDSGNPSGRLMSVPKMEFESSFRYFPKMADGGEMEEVDLFEDYDNIPDDVQKVLDKHSDAFESGDSRMLKKALIDMERIGYTFEYGLDGVAYNLRKMAKGGYMAKGGQLSDAQKKALTFLSNPNTYAWKTLYYGDRTPVLQEGLPQQGGRTENINLKTFDSLISNGFIEKISNSSLGLGKGYNLSVYRISKKGIEKLNGSGDSGSKYDGGEMAKGGKVQPDEVVYIMYTTPKDRFKPQKKYFKGKNAYSEAVEWGRENVPNFKIDMVKFEMEKGGETKKRGVVGVTYFIGRPEVDVVGRFGKKRATWNTCVVDSKGNKNYGSYSINIIGSAKKVKLDGIQISKKEFDDLIFEEEMAKGGMMAEGGEIKGFFRFIPYKLEGNEYVKTILKGEYAGYVSVKGMDGILKKDGKVADARTAEAVAEGILKKYDYVDKVVIEKRKKGKRVNGKLLIAWDYKIVGEFVRDNSNKDNIHKKWFLYDGGTMAKGGKVTFDDKVASIKRSLLERKKVPSRLQKDYGKTYSSSEAQESAKRIAGAMRAKYGK